MVFTPVVAKDVLICIHRPMEATEVALADRDVALLIAMAL